MDNKKIGELIAKLRKEKGLTQQELGDKVNVGSRAVSKWECGTTIPDISIINELSEILGISSSELLAGKLKPKKEIKSKPTLNKKIKIFLFPFLIILIGIISILIYNNNKTYTYSITAIDHEKYRVNGYVTYKSKELTIHINEFIFNDNEMHKIEIKNYQYDITLGEQYIFGYSKGEEDIGKRKLYNIYDVEESIRNVWAEKIKISKEILTENNLIILLTITDTNNRVYTYNIEISIYNSD